MLKLVCRTHSRRLHMGFYRVWCQQTCGRSSSVSHIWVAHPPQFSSCTLVAQCRVSWRGPNAQVFQCGSWKTFGDPRLRDFATGTGCNPCMQSSSLGLGVTSGGETGLLPVSILAATDESFTNGIGLLSVAGGRTLPAYYQKLRPEPTGYMHATECAYMAASYLH